jgi:hypothetical protein
MKIFLGLLFPLALCHAFGQTARTSVPQTARPQPQISSGTTNTSIAPSTVFDIDGVEYPVLSCSLAEENVIASQSGPQEHRITPSRDKDRDIILRLSYRPSTAELFHHWAEAIQKGDVNALHMLKDGALIIRRQNGAKVMIHRINLKNITLEKFSEDRMRGPGNLPVMNITIRAEEMQIVNN